MVHDIRDGILGQRPYSHFRDELRIGRFRISQGGFTESPFFPGGEVSEFCHHAVCELHRVGVPVEEAAGIFFECRIHFLRFRPDPGHGVQIDLTVGGHEIEQFVVVRLSGMPVFVIAHAADQFGCIFDFLMHSHANTPDILPVPEHHFIRCRRNDAAFRLPVPERPDGIPVFL